MSDPPDFLLLEDPQQLRLVVFKETHRDLVDRLAA